MALLARGRKYGDPFWLWQRWICTDAATNGHQLTFGMPGVGKSNAIAYLLEQEVKARRGFVLFDIHQDLFLWALRCLIVHDWPP
jgi:Helicase HerA, central domain